jgi:DNA-binding transcriptional LysR family regulator
MNTRFLDTFVTLARLGSFHATARALHATPAAISQRIKALEAELKTELVDRTATQFRLTVKGESLLPLARGILDATRALQDAAWQDAAVRGRLRLGVIETVVHSWLAIYIQRLNRDYPELEVELTVDATAVLQKRLLAGDLDLIAQVEGIDNPAVVSAALAEYPVRWIARRGLLASRRNGLAQRVLQHPILTFGRGTAPQIALEHVVAHLAHQAGVPLGQTRLTCSPSVAAIIQLISDGYGVAAIPSLFVVPFLHSGEFVELPLKPLPPSIVVSMCHHVDAPLAVRAAAGAAQRVCGDYCTGERGAFIAAL